MKNEGVATAVAAEKKKFTREVAMVEQLVYDEICDEIHKLGTKRYYEILNYGYAKTTERIIDEKYDELYEWFHAKYPEYSKKAFRKVFLFLLDEGEDMAKDRELAY